MFVMRHSKFTPGGLESEIDSSLAFRFGMNDVPRIRMDITTLINGLIPYYKHYKSLQEEVLSTGSDILDQYTHAEMVERNKSTEELGNDCHIDMEELEQVVFSSVNEYEPSPQPTQKRRRKTSPKNKSSPTDNFSRPPAGTRIMRRIRAKNAIAVQPKKSTKNMSDKEKRRRKRAQETEKFFVETSAKSEEMGNTFALGLGVPFSQISLFEDKKVTDVDGDDFCSVDGLNQLRRMYTSVETQTQSSIESEDEKEKAK